jgi:DNA topoisomerase-3
LGFVVDQYNRVQSFVPETFWYIYVAIERQNDNDGLEPAEEEDESRLVEFKWRRNHLFDMEVVIALYEQCVERPMAKVVKVETKPTTKWSVVLISLSAAKDRLMQPRKPLPLTTVELQQSGSRLLHMTPKRILDVSADCVAISGS